MKRSLMIGLAGVATIVGTAAMADLVPAPPPPLAARHAFAQDDCKSALPLARQARDASPALTGNDLMWTNDIIVACEARAGDEDRMYQDALKATASDPSSPYVWRMRLFHEMDKARFDKMLVTIETMARSRQAALNALPIRLAFELHQRLDRAGDSADDFRLLKVLGTIYTPNEPFADVEGLRLLYARKLYARSEKAAATDLVNAIHGFSGLEALSVDPDLRALRVSNLDLSAAAEREYADDQALLARNPESLDGVIHVADDLRRLGRYQDALALLESVRAKVGKPGFSDGLEQQTWWWDSLAETYLLLGDYPHMVENYRAAIALGENGGANISQLLNLAVEQIRFGHYQEALDTLANAKSGPDSISPYGEMVLHYAHGCAATLAGGLNDAAADLDYVAAHEKDGSLSAAGLFLCAGDIDRGAAILVHALNDADHRAGALEMLATYRPDATNVPPDPAAKRIPELLARPDIRAAVAKAGGVPNFPFRRDEL